MSRINGYLSRLITHWKIWPVIFTLLTGCAVGNKTATPIDFKGNVSYTVPNEPIKTQEGSLWDKNGSLNDLGGEKYNSPFLSILIVFSLYCL